MLTASHISRELAGSPTSSLGWRVAPTGLYCHEKAPSFTRGSVAQACGTHGLTLGVTPRVTCCYGS